MICTELFVISVYVVISINKIKQFLRWLKDDRQGFLPARRYASTGNRDCNVSVRLSVRHAPVLCQNEES